MNKILLLLSLVALTGKLAATSYAPKKSHDVESTNGKFTLHVDAEDLTHKVSGKFAARIPEWKFHHSVWLHSFFVSDDGESAAVVHWPYCKVEDLDEAAVVIYGRGGARRIYTYRQLSEPRKLRGDENGPIGDFWRVWRSKAAIKGDLLTIAVEGREPRTIDLKTGRIQ